MQVLVDLDFFPQDIELDGSIAVELIRVINSSLREMLYSQRKMHYFLWEMAIDVYLLPEFLNSPLFGCGKSVWGQTFYGFNRHLPKLL